MWAGKNKARTELGDRSDRQRLQLAKMHRRTRKLMRRILNSGRLELVRDSEVKKICNNLLHRKNFELNAECGLTSLLLSPFNAIINVFRVDSLS